MLKCFNIFKKLLRYPTGIKIAVLCKSLILKKIEYLKKTEHSLLHF